MADVATASATIKTWFETGDVPTQQQFADFITSFPNLVDNNALDGLDLTITAFAGGGQASATQLTKRFNIVTTVATAGDSVKLPAATVGKQLFFYQTTTNSIDIFPQTGEYIGVQAVNTALASQFAYVIVFTCYYTGTWRVQAYSINSQPTPYVTSSVSTAALAPTLGTSSDYEITALAVGVTFNAPVNTWSGGSSFNLRIKDNGTSQTITWNAAYQAASGALPTATVAGKLMSFRFVYDAGTAKYILTSSSVEGQGLINTKVYRALLTQTGTSAPTAVVLENTLGVTPTFSYVGVGNYTLTATGVVTAGKMFARIQAALTGGYWSSVNTLSSPNTVQIQTFNNVGGGTNAQLNSTPIEIIIYP